MFLCVYVPPYIHSTVCIFHRLYTLCIHPTVFTLCVYTPPYLHSVYTLHRVYTSPFVHSIACTLHHLYTPHISPFVSISLYIYSSICLSPACICLSIYMYHRIHRVYNLLYIHSTLFSLHYVYTPPCVFSTICTLPLCISLYVCISICISPLYIYPIMCRYHRVCPSVHISLCVYSFICIFPPYVCPSVCIYHRIYILSYIYYNVSKII